MKWFDSKGLSGLPNQEGGGGVNRVGYRTCYAGSWSQNAMCSRGVAGKIWPDLTAQLLEALHLGPSSSADPRIYSNLQI